MPSPPTSGERLKGHLDLLLLATVRDGPAHGYAVAQRLRERSDGAFDLPEGTVYPALHRLEAEGLLASTWSRESGRARRTYRLTAPGVAVLARRTVEWQAFATGVGEVLGMLPGGAGPVTA